ncbi:enoyl-CoA hydratase [Gilvimarinus algae]|uniref:Enoyl-CoA hydratase n=1 Tax=Gilvimarinus algae TaxID=3058037 RepID=A0ABT8TFQ1_9GAMM|nr:enoyl-CoA hydratase [Gilvimarinus sp. SDUM040014]MDO3382924.1 enoyl-CoA hydratase [Gilvimarinus sp. SDUM040014]
MDLPFSPCAQLSVTLTRGILSLVLNRPAQKNALSLAMYTSLTEALRWAAQAPEVRVVRLSGSEDSFTAGNDLADFLAAGELNSEHPAVQFMGALMALPQPMVAEVNGLAVGIGTTLLLHCDFVYASEDAYFQLPFVRLGLSPEFGASSLLARRVGEARARELLLLGDRLEALEAERIGLINGVYPLERLAEEVEWVCKELAKLPPQALARSKALLNAVAGWPLDKVIAQELDVFAQCLDGEEAKQAIAAMMNKEQV